MIRDESGRAVIHCDRCPVRLDIGPTAIVQHHLRMPSGWFQAAPEHHLCPTCSRKEMAEIAAKAPPQPLP